MPKRISLGCPPVGEGRIPEIKENIKCWLSQKALADLVISFGGSPPTNLSLAGLSSWYLNFSDCFDFRRWQAQAAEAKTGENARWLTDSASLSEHQKSLAMIAAKDLGLTDNNITSLEHFDYVLVLGGARLSCLLRSRLACKSSTHAAKPPKAVVMLASMRPIGDSERAATDTYAPNAETEFDLFIAAAAQEFCLSGDYRETQHIDEENQNCSWVMRTYETTGVDVVIIAAPSSNPHVRRANTADTYEFFMKNFQIAEGSSVLLTTSQIYVPYQQMEAIRTVALPHNLNLDTIGFPPEWSSVLQGMNEPQNYLQEIRSAIQSIARFLDEY